MSATSRDPEEWAAATQAARETRELAAAEVAANVADQVYDLIVAGDIMGGRALAVSRIGQVAAAERRQDPEALRSACMDAAVGFGAWVASLDHVGDRAP